jgi:hypothetical protein
LSGALSQPQETDIKMTSSTWRSSPPADCPFEPSTLLGGIAFTGRQAAYTSADTWYPSWASDDALYSGWTDGNFAEDKIGLPFELPFECQSFPKKDAPAGQEGLTGTGQARIVGDDPLNLTLENLGIHHANAQPYGGRYPGGSLVHNGVWYYGTYCLDQSGRKSADGLTLNWDVLGPFVGFRTSTDYGATWTACPHTPSKPLFGESGKDGGKVKFGALHFVDFGKNMQHAPDGYAYLVGHGGSDAQAEVAWIRGDEAYLCRVKPSLTTINDSGAYEFFAGHAADGSPKWSRSFDDIEPVLRWPGRIGHVTMTYNPALRRYLLCATDGGDTVHRFNSYLMESEAPTGPWRLVVFMEDFGQQAYFLNIPSKFISADGLTAWLCYSANFTNHYLETTWQSDPPGSKYALCLQEFRLSKT